MEEQQATATAAIELRDVRKAYTQGRREVVAVDGASLRVERGEFVAITGPSGSGKSTLLHLAGGLDRPTAGDVLIDGENTRTMDDARLTRLRRRRIGFVFQFFNLLPTLKVLQNVALPALLNGSTRAAARQRAEALLERVGLAARLDHYPEELSGGEMQRVALARALVADPLIVLADEPTGNLDSATGSDMLALLREACRERTLVLVTHDERAAAAASRVMRIRDGRLA